LANSKEFDLRFCATESVEAISGCLDYLKSSEQLKAVPFLLPKSAKYAGLLNKKLNRLYAEVKDASELKRMTEVRDLRGFAREFKPHRRTLIRPLAYVINGMKARFRPLDPRSLARADLFHSPFYPLPEQTRNVKRVLTVYDLIPILYPHFCIPAQLPFLNSVLKSLSPEDWVLCISHATKNDLCDYLKLDPSRVFVTYLAAAPHVFYRCPDPERIALARSKYSIPDAPYILSLSTLEPRKNIDHVVRSFARLIHEQKIKDLHLVLVGSKGWHYDKIFDSISDIGPLKDRIIVTGYVADEDLAPLYTDALAFIYPSFCEGFGLPPLEAMQCGVPVITSNTTSLPEIVGDAGIMLDPLDIDGLCHSILQIYRDSSLRKSMSKKSLERAKQFSWEKCTQETIAAYKASLNI